MSSTNSDFYALVDCNSFYVSCERLFNPKLQKRPVVVLSNNDGCVISLSKEAKNLGIKMGAPAFQNTSFFKENGVVALSSNYTLYADISHRVMETIKQFFSDVQQYSIDEAFLLMPRLNAEEQALNLRKTILKWVGIPVSIGISTSKTLAKMANRLAKKTSDSEGVLLIAPDVRESMLKKISVEDVWGIGQRISTQLHTFGVETAWDFANLDDYFIKKHFTVVCLRIAWELRGVSCLPIEEILPEKKSITRSRSFSRSIVKFEELEEAISTYTSWAAEKLRQEESLASFMTIWVETNRFNESNLYYSNCSQVVFEEPTSFTPALIDYAKRALQKIFRPALKYHKAGVLMGGLVSKDCYQPDLFCKGSFRSKEEILMRVTDELNEKYGRKVIRLAAEGMKQEWRMKRNYCTPHFTTRWSDIPIVRI